MHKLFVKVGQGYTPLTAYALNEKPQRVIRIDFAIETYISVCTSAKCKKNQNSEKLYFHRLHDFLTAKGIELLPDITALIMEEFQSILLAQMKVSSVNRRFNSFKHFFAKCEEWDFILVSPCRRMKKKKEEFNPHQPWTKRVFKRFIKRTSGIYTYLFTFLWLTGARPMEAKNLKWTDINYEAGTITLRCGKNAKITREFLISDPLSALLHQIPLDSIHVFTDNGKQIDNDLLYHYCKTRMKAMGELIYTVYGLRHAFGSRVPRIARCDAYELMELMGHSKMETTKRYRHVDKKNLLKILNKVK